MAAPRALITGTNGQCGVYLSRLLLDRGYDVTGLVRRESRATATALLDPRVLLDDLNLLSQPDLETTVARYQPDLVFHLAARLSVPESWEDPAAHADVNALGTARLLEAVRRHAPEARFFYASSSEALGRPSSPDAVFDERSPLRPATPYGASKAFGHHLVRAYRDRYGMFAVNGLLFNMESPVGVRASVVQHVAASMVRIAAGRQPPAMPIGNLDAQRDWGFAGDYAEAAALMLAAAEPEDLVVATGVVHTVRDLVETAAAVAGIPMPALEVTEERLRPGEVNRLAADPSRIRERLGWCARTDLRDLLETIMGDRTFRARALAGV